MRIEVMVKTNWNYLAWEMRKRMDNTKLLPFSMKFQLHLPPTFYYLKISVINNRITRNIYVTFSFNVLYIYPLTQFLIVPIFHCLKFPLYQASHVSSILLSKFLFYLSFQLLQAFHCVSLRLRIPQLPITSTSHYPSFSSSQFLIFSSFPLPQFPSTPFSVYPTLSLSYFLNSPSL